MRPLRFLIVILALGASLLWLRGRTRSSIDPIPEAIPAGDRETHELESASVAGSARVENPGETTAANSKLETSGPAVPETVEVDEFDLELSRRDLSKEAWGTTVLGFEKPGVYAKDPRFNPRGVELGPDELRQLRDLISRLNQRLMFSRNEISTLVNSHVQDKIDRGEALVTTDGSEPDWHSLGEEGIPVGRAQGSSSYYLKMKKGDFADLDRAQHHISALVSLGEEWIARSFQ